jgi:hypothetical protein
VVSGLQINGLPVAGPFNPNLVGANGQLTDEIALFSNGTWYIDYNHTNNISAKTDVVIHDGLQGYPIVGDFDGSGNISLATYDPANKTFYFDLDPFVPSLHTFTSFTIKSGNSLLNNPGVLARPVAALTVSRSGKSTT